MRLAAAVLTGLALALAAPAAALAAPVTIPNDVAPAEQFNVTDPGGVVDELHAHGGGMIRVGDHFYWFGEWRQPNGTIDRVPVYRSQNLKNWEYRGAALPRSAVPGSLNLPNIERPKVIYNAEHDHYVMWMHLETNGNYNAAEAAVAVADDVEGPYEWVGNFRPNVPVAGAQPTHAAPPHMSRDITAFVDDDGAGYMISAADDNRDLHIYRLNDDYTGFAPSGHYLVWNDQWREAPIVFKRDGIYFLLTSGATGWSPNLQMYATTTSMAGPWTQPSPVPFANQSAFETQGAHAIAVQGAETTSYLYLADRWAGSFMPTPSVQQSRYVWLPLEFPTARSVDMRWADSVSIDTETGEIEGAVDEPPDGRRLAVEDIAVGSTSSAPQSSHHPFLHALAHNSAANMVDGRHETAWISANAEQGGSPATSWAQFDLGEVTTVDTVRLMLFRGGVRSHPLEVQVGEAPGSLEPVWSGETEMKTGFHELEFEPTEGRYVRVSLTGQGTGDFSNSNAMVPRSSFGIVEAELYDTGEASAEGCSSLRSDEFDGAALDSWRWDFLHPRTPTAGPDAPSVAGGSLSLPTLAGEPDNDGPISFVGQPLPPGEHWSVTAKLTLAHAAGWQQAGLLLYGDDENFIRLTFTRNNSGGATGQRFFELVTVRSGTKAQSPQYNLSPNHPDTVLVRLTRIENQVVARFSPGVGITFHTQGGIWVPQSAGDQNAFHGSTNRTMTGLTGPGVRIGPYAGGGTEVGPTPIAAFDWVRIGPDAEFCAGDDVTPPATTASLDPAEPDGNAGWYVSPVEVTLSADDGPGGSGVASTHYRINGGPLEDYSGPFTIAEDGIHDVEYFSVDNAGNVEDAKTLDLQIDMTPPETVHHIDPGEPDGDDGWYVSPVEVELEVLDEPDIVSGGCCPEYRIDGGAWTPYGGPVTLSEDGERLLEYRARDGAGNVEEPKAATIRIDSTPPTTSVALDAANPDAPGGGYHGPVTMTFTAADASSGVRRTEYRLGGDWTEYDPAAPPSVADLGEHEIRFRSIDVAGNVEGEKSVAFPIVGAAEIHARLMPAIRRVGAKRRKSAFRLRVTNTGEGTAGSIRICVRAPRKRLRIRGPACRAYPALAADASVQRVIRGRIMRRARGRTTRVRFVVDGPSVSRVRAVARLVVRR